MPKRTNETDAQLTALQSAWGSTLFPTLDAVAAFVIDRYHAAHFGGVLPDGWALNEDLGLADMEAYYDAMAVEVGAGKPGRNSVWHARGRTIRAARAAGWIAAPSGLTDEAIGKLKPHEAAQIKNAIDAHTIRLTQPDPNSLGPSPTT